MGVLGENANLGFSELTLIRFLIGWHPRGPAGLNKKTDFFSGLRFKEQNAKINNHNGATAVGP